MEKWNDLKPDIKFLQFNLEKFRLLIARDRNADDTDILKRMEFELLLLQTQTQERHIDTLERSIESQDRFSRYTNFLAFSALILATVEILIALFK